MVVNDSGVVQGANVGDTIAATEGGMFLARLDARCSEGSFLEACWDEQHRLFPHVFGARELADYLPLAALDRLVLSGGLGPPDLEVIANGRAHAVRQTRSLAPSTDTDHLLQEVSKGASFRIQHLDRYLPELASLCRILERDMGFPVRANLYMTPAHAQGFAPHYDSSDAFILQVSGRKHWQVYPSYTNQLVRPPAAIKFSETAHRPLGQPDDLLLSAGDVLYLPRGVMHAARTGDEPSIHVTLAVLGVTWSDLLFEIVKAATVSDADFRRLLPQAGDGRHAAAEDPAAEVDRLLQRLRSCDYVGQILGRRGDALAAHRPPSRIGGLLDLLRREGVAS